jgi:hypothetical protein
VTERFTVQHEGVTYEVEDITGTGGDEAPLDPEHRWRRRFAVYHKGKRLRSVWLSVHGFAVDNVHNTARDLDDARLERAAHSYYRDDFARHVPAVLEHGDTYDPEHPWQYVYPATSGIEEELIQRARV